MLLEPQHKKDFDQHTLLFLFLVPFLSLIGTQRTEIGDRWAGVENRNIRRSRKNPSFPLSETQMDRVVLKT